MFSKRTLNNYRALLLFSISGLPSACAEETGESGFAGKRQKMVAIQLEPEINDKRVLQAMGEVPRHEFVPAIRRKFAYMDSPLPIGHGQTISQPYIVAFMTEQLAPKPTDRVLEIGTGSGYQAAVLSKLVQEVYSIEIVEALAKRAKEVITRLKYRNISLKTGDGYQGWPDAAPFDAIIVTCAPDHIPQPLVEQLREGGKMIIPVGKDGGVQNLVLLRKTKGKIHQQAVLPVRFVPMTGESKKKEGKPGR